MKIFGNIYADFSLSCEFFFVPLHPDMKSALMGILIPLVILLIAVIAMAFRPLFIRKGKYGKFPNTHVCKHKFK